MFFEALQLVVSVVGASLEAAALVHARRDAFGVTNYGERLVARTNIERATVLLVAQLLLVLVGVVSVTLPLDEFWQPIRIAAVRVALMAVSVALMAKSAQTLKRRRDQVVYLLSTEDRGSDVGKDEKRS